jgi:hypothetical protein
MRSWVLVFLFWFIPSSAVAVGQGEASLSGGLGPTLAIHDQTRIGVQADIRLLRGLTDAWAGRLGVQMAWIPASKGMGSSFVTTQAVGLTWAADVLNLVPFVDIGLTAADVRGGGIAKSQRIGAQLGIGIDYLVSRHFIFTVLGHIDYLGLCLAGSSEPRPTQITIAFHLGRVF